MDSIWLQVRTLKGQTLYTLKQRKPFDVAEVDDSAIFVRPHDTKTPRQSRRIPRQAIEDAYRFYRSGGPLTPTAVRAQGISEFNPVYVVAIVAKLAGDPG